MDSFRQDLRYALRQLGRARGFTAVAVATLALGIGANTAMFSLVRGVLLRPLPYPHSERLLTAGVSLPDYEDLRGAATVFDETAAWASNLYQLGGEDGGEQVRGAVVSERFFPMLGGAARGRALFPGDARDKVVVLAHGLWSRRFAADPAVVGRAVRLSGESYTVVGVMGPEFQFPSGEFDLWVPLEGVMAAAPAQVQNRSLRIFRALARLAPGVTRAQAQGQVDGIAARLAREHPATNEGIGITFTPIHEALVGGVRTALLVLMGVVALVLLIASANVANLLLARAKSREREIAVRTALGAGRGRLVAQLLTESLLLAAAGSAAGVLLARWLLDVLPVVAGDVVPRMTSVRIDSGVLAFTAAVTVATGLLFGLAPAWQASRTDAAHGLREGGRGSAGRAARRLRAGLTAAEVALALVVLVGAGLLVQSLARLMRVDTGFVADNLLTFHVQMAAGPASRPPARRAELATQLMERLSRIPGVTAVGGGSGLPPVTAQRGTGFVAEGVAESSASSRRSYFLAVTPGYFRALGTPVREGRSFGEKDGAGAPEVVVLNRSLARRLYGAESALGRRLRLVNPGEGEGWRTVVGVVDDVRYSGLDDPGEAAIYTPFAQTPFPWTYVMVRTQGPPTAVARAVSEVVASVDPALEAAGIKPMSELVAGAVARPRFNVRLLSLFAALALVLAAVGIYGVLSYSVVQRRREIGIRMALGAQRGDVLRLVAGEGLRLAGVGVLAGLLGAVAATRVMASLLFEVRATDAATYASAAGFLLVVALAASAVPAWRATRVAPVSALRAE
ncbi:MAG TPA: ABC transporter permease [Vicinamibacteria bacterium]|nr:ABC transporter permease [Vicinamibacteria bacterium]